MKKLYFLFALVLTTILTQAQVFTFSGQVKDYETGETLIGANVLVKQGLGTITTPDGNFSIKLDKGKYSVVVSYVGFDPIKYELNLDKDVYKQFSLKPQMIGEISVVSDVARERETPVAFSTIKPAKIEEELAARDLPMVLNSTPGVYATQQGGGDGDARVNIRGFNQRNVAVMLDGIPVNDMENGWVYWSNWFGLDLVTRSMQVQRGLSASKLTIPSVGGSMNIITKGIENKRETSFKQEIDSDGKLRTSLGFTSGKLKNGWGFTLAGSYKGGDGYVDETWTKAWFYYAKIDKRIGDHIISFSAMGAPQEHGQRYYQRAIATYDSAYAVSLGVDTFPAVVNQGLRYNQNWGNLERWTYGNNIVDSVFFPATMSYQYVRDTIHTSSEPVHYKYNLYHKPMFSLRDFWTVNDKLYISNILYLSIGQGGGSATKNSLKDSDLDEFGQINWQSIYDANQKTTGAITAIDNQYSSTLFKASNYRVMNMNEHIWYGLLSTFNYKQNNNLTWSGGLDLRSYKGTHYRKIIDLLGGDYAVDLYDANQDTAVKYVGDKVYFHDDAWVNWGGIFGQVEYTSGLWTMFGNISMAESGFNKIDYFKLPTDENRESGWLWKTSYTFKGGVNYNLNEHSNLFMNTGYLSKTRASNYLYDGYLAKFRENTANEIVKALELGYSYHSGKFSSNVNIYRTQWQNKPMEDIRVGQDYTARVDGIDQLHQGVELDFIYLISKKLQVQGLVSIGDWTYQSKVDSVPYFEYNAENVIVGYFNFDAKGVHVGDAAQSQFMASLRYEPIDNLYFNASYIFFDRNYSEFSPSSLNGEGDALDEDGNSTDSWRIPAYGLMDIHAGYSFKVSDVRMSIRFSITNVLNTTYVSDATNNDQYIYGTSPNDFGVNSAAAFLGLGTRFNTSFSINF